MTETAAPRLFDRALLAARPMRMYSCIASISAPIRLAASRMRASPAAASSPWPASMA